MDAIMASAAALPRFLLALALLVAGRALFEKLAGLDVQGEVNTKANPAAGTWLAGQMLGLGLALRGALFGGGEDALWDLLPLAIGGGLALVLLPAGSWIVDRLVLPRFDARVEVGRDRNLGTGAVLAASAIASGLVLEGALTGSSESVLLGVRDLLLYFVVAQVFLVAGGLVYSKIAPFDVHDAIEHKDSAAAGFALGGFLLGMGLVARGAVMGAGSDLLHELYVLAVDGALGLVVLAAAASLMARAMLRAPLLVALSEKHNAAAGLVVGTAHAVTGLLLAGALRPW